MELNLNYVHSMSMGYGRAGVSLANALEEMGVDVYDDMPMPDSYRRTHEHNRGAKQGLCNVVAWVSTPAHARGWWQGQHPVLLSMWEAQRLPESFRSKLHEFQTIIVPSHHNQELFSNYHDNVKMVPLGVDPADWFFQPRKPPVMFFDFLIGGSGLRKGTDLAYKAFRKTFDTWPKDGPIPRLIFKNPRREDFYGDRIEVIGGKISAEAEIDLYAQAHCYLQPSRGEGFGLQPLQAMAQGCPTILTAAHGHDSFAHLGRGISAGASKSAYFIYGDAGNWWEPSLDELCDQMRWVYDNYDLACVEARASAEVIADQFTWAHTAAGFVQAVGPDEFCKSAPSLTNWHETEEKRYLVVTNKDWACDIAGRMYQFKRGEEYWHVPEVKRILFEAELLDPRCLEQDTEDLGITPEQLARLPEYKTNHSHCLTCGQPLR